MKWRKVKTSRQTSYIIYCSRIQYYVIISNIYVIIFIVYRQIFYYSEIHVYLLGFFLISKEINLFRVCINKLILNIYVIIFIVYRQIFYCL